MAAEMVILENLERTLGSFLEHTLLRPLTEKLRILLAQVTNAREVVAYLERHDSIYALLGNQVNDLSNCPNRGRQKKLSKWLHQADDLLDQIVTFDQRLAHCRGRHGVNAMARITQEVGLFLSPSNQLVFPKIMAGKVEKASNDLKTLVGELRGSSRQPDARPFQPDEDHEVTPSRCRVTGRECDRKKFVDMLLQPPKDSKSNVSVICMTGLPGVGKSTLAKYMYDDNKVESHFDLRMWIPVPQITDEKQVIREIVESCTGRRLSAYHSHLDRQNDLISFRDRIRCRGSSTSPSLTNDTKSDCKDETDIHGQRLRKEIRGKLYLLILDDVSVEKWQSLKDVLAGGARGSQILVTTKSKKVADLLKRETGNEPYPLQGLTEDHSWDLFERLTSKFDPSSGFSSEAERRQIGLDIAKTCKHAPLTLKVAARFLQRKGKDEWIRFKEELHGNEGVMEHVLYLSYSELPTRLRACFGYCSLFPDDFTFKKHDLISMWIAQGFVIPHNDGSLEEAAEMYLMELLRRYLFEIVSTDGSGNILTCKMHHNACRLATKFMAGVANIHRPDYGMIHVTDQACKHASVNCRRGTSLKFSSPLLNNSPNVHTLISVKEPDCEIKIDTRVCNQLISSYTRLRVLDLHDLGLTELPDSIGDQIHLRYLDLSKNDGLTTLPKSFTRLHNLETLKLNSCHKLKKLTNFGLLAKLRRFEVDGCDSLTCMPFGLEKLTQLQTLSRFVVGSGSTKKTASVGFQALSKLTMLRGRLAIELTGDWMTGNIAEAKQALCTKENLVEVKIIWPQRASEVQVSSEDDRLSQERLSQERLSHEELLENLKPNSNLKILDIEGYKGNNFPSWANKEIMSSLPNLVIISIEGCGKCPYLPPFGELHHLKKLTLRHMAEVQYIEDATSLESPVGEMLETVEERPFFKSLEELTLHNFYNLEGWRREVASLHRSTIRSFPQLSKLRIWNCPKLTSFPLFTKVLDVSLHNVNHLLLEECEKKASLLQSGSYTNRLQIKGCLGLESLGAIRNGLGGLLSLKHLVIESCNALISLADDVTQITSLETLEISSCKNLDLAIVKALPLSPWTNLKSLRELTLREIPKMVTLPEGLKHVKTLKTLRIFSCRSLGTLPEWISSLTNLRYLRIENCQSLKSLPKELKDVTSLMKVEITECPELMQRCREHTGKDWPNIKHARVLLHKSKRYGYRMHTGASPEVGYTGRSPV